MNSPLSKKTLSRLVAIVGADHLLTAAADCWPYGYDNSRQHSLPSAVLMPATQQQVAELVRLCNEEKLTIVARGHGTGTAGAAIPAEGGLVLSLERMARILRVDPANRLMVVEPGVTNQAAQKAAAEVGFFWPPDPTSATVCTIGGNLACNAAGPRAVKYGTPRENVLGLRAVTGTGEELRTGVYTTKGVVGYDLTRLLIGSEGTLGIITEATLKLTPLPEAKRTLRAIYADMQSAASAVSRIMAQPVIPCALEFIDGRAIEMIRDYSQAELPLEAGSLLMIEVDGPAAYLDDACQAVMNAAQGEGCLELTQAETSEQVASLWRTRKALSPALRTVAPKKINEDVVVPVSRIPELIDGLDKLGRQHHITIVNFGHAGNGNIHVNLLVNPDDAQEMAQAEQCLSDLFDLVLQLEGSLSGEHGIGLVKREFVSRELDPVAMQLMYRIKDQFDPNGILNPGKGLPIEQQNESN
ncbi:MAG: FAD-binding protein [Gammaproteobacteria bacterium]|nr:FAD-binding protein [Gammaproteobacteria bacterium]